MDIGKHDEKIGCTVLSILALLIIIPSSTGYIDCRISCRRCHENTEHPSVLEVYCAMCEECKQRRRERMQGRTSSSRTTVTPLVRMRGNVEDSAEALAKSLMLAPPAIQPAEQSSQQQYQGQPSQQVQQTQRTPPAQPAQPEESAPPAQPPQPAQSAQPAPSAQPPHQVQTPHQVQPPQQMQPAQSAQPPQQVQPHQHKHHPPRPAQRELYVDYYERRVPVGCPTPPLCSDSEEEEFLTMMTTTTSTTTTTTTMAPTRPPCPPVQTCRKKKKRGCMPCMPMCPCPIYTYPPGAIMITQPNPASTTAQMDYHYMFIGLPRNVLKLS